ncbi:TonB-dependent receptor [Erythrobacter aquimaris]|uniref:TonB-dependent receptor n=2 Tax=Qipengyuania aquimaris TaxID=255984 RepID=A0A6I4TJW1_9SPHN|nr:TonB-dependent receptor [Qipengyuania aquimaris]
MAAAPALAQDQDAEVDAVSAADLEQENTDRSGDAIIVTGTRISNPNLELASPVAVVGEEELALQATSTVEETLREIPGAVASLGSNLNNGNGGSTFINLRGVGSNRNITLLNGTRLVPADTSLRVNLDIIPTALLERVDVLTGGAGSTYGADAVSGVINFVTKTDFEGAELTVLNSITEEGDGYVGRADLTLGANLEDGRGNVVLNLGYTKRDPIRQGQRDYSEFNISSFSGNPGGSSTTTPIRISAAGGASGILGNISTDPDTGAESNTGFLQLDPDAGVLRPGFTPFNFNPFNYFQLPLEQYRIYAQGNYEISPAFEVFAEAMYVDNEVRTNGAPSGTFGVTAPIPLSNPFLPQGIVDQICAADTLLYVPAIPDDPATPEDESAPAVSAPGQVEAFLDPAACAAARAATDPDDPNFTTVNLTLGRRLVEFGERLSVRETKQFQIKTGVRGEISPTLNYEAFFSYGESDRTRKQSGNGLRSRLLQSLNSTSTDQCLDTTNGCVPINLFGPTGSVQPEAQAFIDTGNQQSNFNRLTQAGAYIEGEPGFTLPWALSGVSFVLGTEYREYTAGASSDILSQTPSEVLGNGAATPDFTGSYDVKEAYGELVVPLVEGKSFFDELTLQLGGRVSDYSTTGTEYTWKVGATWAPVPSLLFRGNYQKVTRAPNIFELFNPQVTGLANFSADPCAGSAPLSNADLRAICLAQGATSGQIGGIIIDPAGQVNVTSGGNPNLDSEDANTWTIGAIFSPDFLPGFTATIDYYNIEVTDAITIPTEDDIFANCFGVNYADGSLAIDGSSASDPACTGIRRNPATGNLFGELATTPGLPQVRTNQGKIFTDGIDLTMAYSAPLTDSIDWNSSFQGNWTNSSTFQASPNGLDRECVGFYSSNCASLQPEFSFNWRNTFSFNDVSVSVAWRWLDSFEYEPISDPSRFVEEFTTIDSYSLVDLSARAKVLDSLDFIFGIQNVFDKTPPLVGSNIGSTGFNSGNTYPSNYDVRGRSYSLTLKLGF